MNWKQNLRVAWRWAVVVMILMSLFWGLWYLIAGHLPVIPETLQYDPPSSKATIAVPGWLLHSHWWDIPGIGLAMLLTVFSLACLFDYADDFISGDGETGIFIGHLGVMLCTLIGQLVNAGGRDWIGLTVHTPLVALILSSGFVLAQGIYAYFDRTRRYGIPLHLACTAFHGLLLGLAVGLTGLGLVWPPLIGAVAGLGGVFAALLVLGAAAVLAAVIWTIIRFGLLLASPRAEFERLKWRWWRWTGLDADGTPPDGNWDVTVRADRYQEVTGRTDWSEWLEQAEALCETGSLVMIRAKCSDGYGGRTATVMGKRRGGYGWVKVRLNRPLPGKPRQTYFRIGAAAEDSYQRDLELIRQADGTPVNFDPLYPHGHRPTHLPES